MKAPIVDVVLASFSGLLGLGGVGTALSSDDENAQSEGAGVAVVLIPTSIVFAISATSGMRKVRACRQAQVDYLRTR
jgi:hypothetical protein